MDPGISALVLLCSALLGAGSGAGAECGGGDCSTLTRHTLHHWLGRGSRNNNNGFRDKHIRHLTLTGRKIKHVAKHSFSEVPHLKHLNLSHNVISHIDRNTFDNLSNLRQLSISHNHLKTLEKELFQPLTNLETLHLDHNYLEDINEVFLVLGNLKYLSLVHNSVKWFDMAFFPKSVQTINLSKNMIEEIGNYFKMLDGFSLQSLDLSYNRIFSLEARIFVESLEEINLEGNKISEIAAGTFADLPNIRRVNLRHNALKTVARSSFQLFQSVGLRAVYLVSGNPLLCDCSLEWARGAAGAGLADLGQLTCSRPGQEGGVAAVAGGAPFLCHYTTHCFSLCRCCTFLACDCRMSCPDMCTCSHDESWTVNLIRCGDRNLTEVPRQIPMDATTVFLDNNRMPHLGPEIFLGRSRVSALYLNNSNIQGLSNGTFLGLSALEQLYLSHNEIERIESGHLSGLARLEVLRLEHNRLQHLAGSLLGGLASLRVLTLHSNLLVSLELQLQSHAVTMHLVTIHDNRWQCSSEADCTWITRTVDTLNKSAVKYLNQVTCASSGGEAQQLVSFASSCRALDVLPVSAPQATSPVLVILVSVAVVILLIVTTSVTVFLVQHRLARKRRSCLHPGTTYLHYCMADDGYVRRHVSGEVARVTARVCHHHGDTSTQLSVGQAISSAVSSSCALVVVATPGYLQSAVTAAELHILAECAAARGGGGQYPVVVAGLQQPLHQIREQLARTVGCSSQDWVFINDLTQLSSVLDRLLLSSAPSCSWYGRFLQLCPAPAPPLAPPPAPDSSEYGGSGDTEVSGDSDTRTLATWTREADTRTLATLVSSSVSPASTRTLPGPVQPQPGLATKFGTGRLFSNPLDRRRPDIIYHHPALAPRYHECPSDNTYETISHCKNVKNSVI